MTPEETPEPPRAIVGTSWGLRCTRCGLMFEDEVEAEDHLNGPMCEAKGESQ